jgi:hypothetical protein
LSLRKPDSDGLAAGRWARTAGAGVWAADESAGFDGDGGPAWAALLYQPQGVASDPAGRLYIMDTRNNCIRLLSR